jgi:hypothetical protein
MNRNPICSTADFALVVLVVSCNISIAQDISVEKAKILWEKVIQAKGGRQNLQNVKTLVVTTKRMNPNDKKEFRSAYYVDVFELPGRWWRWVDERPGFSINGRHV